MSGPQVIQVANELELNQAIATVDGAGSGDFIIQFTADITEGTDTGGSITFNGKTLSAPADLYALNLQSGVSLTIDGGGYMLSGANMYRGFFAYAGAVTVQNLAISNTAAIGGYGGYGGGGGGAGLGGGLFVAAGAQVTLSGVNFSGDQAQGGHGGNDGWRPYRFEFHGGGGGLGGSGAQNFETGDQGNGGGIGAGANGNGPGDGIVLGAPTLAHRTPGSAPYGGAGTPYNGGGIGSVATSRSGFNYNTISGVGGNGGFGGGGGGGYRTQLGGNGGFGGGGGAGYKVGGNGGFGGGGGGANGQGLYGYGGFGGGNGAASPIYSPHYFAPAGGGGLGAGGAIFVQQGGTLIVGAGGIAGGVVQGGAGGTAINTGTAQSGSAFGSGIFVQGNDTLTFAPGFGQTLTIADVIADQSGSGGTGANAGAAAIVVKGPGTVILGAANTFTGGTTIEAGILELGNVQGAGTGAITFAPGAPALAALLQIDGAIMPGNQIDGFLPGDLILLKDIANAPGSHADMNYTTNVLTITEGANSYQIDFNPNENFAGDVFRLSSVNGGTEINEISTPCYCPGTLIRTPRGERRVETLETGDKVVTASGAKRRIKWIGRRSYAGRFVLGRKDILPVCIKAGALGSNVPERDLWISPHHAMYFGDGGGVLIEAKDLVNGTSIVQADRVDKVEYFHIELETHDVIIAEGALSETYLDDDNRVMFHNALEYETLYAGEDAWQPASYCAPRLGDGYVVENVRRRIAARTRAPRISVYRRAGA